MAPVTKIQVDITTGNQDPDSNIRIFLGFDPRNVQANPTRFSGREFRLRKGNDANPFRGGPEQLIFGIGNNVKNPGLNDPQTPYPLESDDIAGVYIRVSPLSKESWSINSAILQLFEGSPPTPIAGRRYDLPQGASIILQEDGSESVSATSRSPSARGDRGDASNPDAGQCRPTRCRQSHRRPRLSQPAIRHLA